MKHIIYTSINFWLLTSLFFLLPIPISAQGMGNCDPDALELVTKQGKAVVEVKGSIVKYFLDENEAKRR